MMKVSWWREREGRGGGDGGRRFHKGRERKEEGEMHFFKKN